MPWLGRETSLIRRPSRRRFPKATAAAARHHLIGPRRRLLLALIVLSLLGPLGLGWLPGEKAKRVRWAIKRPLLILSGQLVDVGGHRLRIECKGAGSPIVVMDAGLDMTRDTWGIVPRGVATFTRACTYERAGLGESDRATPTPRTSERIVTDLHALLRNAGGRDLSCSSVIRSVASTSVYKRAAIRSRSEDWSWSTRLTRTNTSATPRSKRLANVTSI